MKKLRIWRGAKECTSYLEPSRAFFGREYAAFGAKWWEKKQGNRDIGKDANNSVIASIAMTKFFIFDGIVDIESIEQAAKHRHKIEANVVQGRRFLSPRLFFFSSAVLYERRRRDLRNALRLRDGEYRAQDSNTSCREG